MIWAAAFRPETLGAGDGGDRLRDGARRLAALVSPALAQFLLAEAERRLGIALVDAGTARQSRLFNRLNAARQARWVNALDAAGFRFVCLKGFAAARTLYPDAALRSTGDLDLLVRRRDLAAVIDFLARHGFAFASGPQPRWGFISDASFVPFVGPDGENIDLHVHPDAYPAHRSLTTEQVFQAARRISATDAAFLAPAPEHVFALCATNAAKDKFGPFAAAKLIDAARLLAAEPGLDAAAVAGLAAAGGFAKPTRVFVALLAAMGAETRGISGVLGPPPRGISGREFRRLVASWQALFAVPDGPGAVLRRELLLSTEPRVGLHNTIARLAGLVRPRSGVPILEERRA
jgi:hypothetical protein